MKAVKDNTTDVDKAVKELLNRKNIIEVLVTQLKEGERIYSEAIRKNKVNELESYEYSQKLDAIRVKIKNLLDAYNRDILPKLKNVEGDTISRLDSISKRLMDENLYGDINYKPTNIELPSVIQNLKKHKALVDEEIVFLQKLPLKYSDNVKLYELKVQSLTLGKRIIERTKHYENVFLPQYKKDMELYRKLGSTYKDRAKVFAGFDIVLAEMLKTENDILKDKEMLWQFWTSLKTRVDLIIQELNKDVSKCPENLKKYIKKIS